MLTREHAKVTLHLAVEGWLGVGRFSFVLAGIGTVLACCGAQAQDLSTYTYDAIGRLKAVNRDTPASATVTSYAFDGADNRVLRASGSVFAQSWEAEALYHQVGFADGDGWAANVNQPEGFVVYGPYASAPVGSRVAVYRMMIDVADVPDSGPVVRIDVWNATAGQLLAIRDIPRAAFHGNWTYQSFELPFELSAAHAGHALEYRIYFIPKAHVRIDKVGYR